MSARSRNDLVALLAEVQAADDDRWTDAVMDLVDDLAHSSASERVNAGSGYDEAHDVADAVRADLHNAAAETVAAWLVEQLGLEGTFAELDTRLS